MRLRRLAGLALLLLPAMFAQSDRGTITGTVSDQTGARAPRVSILALEASTGAQYRTESTDTGNYTLPSLPAGTYQLTFEAPGFKKYEQSGITVQVAQTARIDIEMQVGSTTEAVTITSDAPLLKTESADVSTTISRERLNSLQLNFAGNGAIRNPLQFATLAPGATIQGITNIRINGLPNTSFKITVEGQDITSGNLQDRADETQPSVEMMQEFTLQTSNFSAEFGQVGGGLFNFTARSGTNQLHGSVYEYFTNEKLNADQPYQTVTGDPNMHVRTKTRRHDFGFTVGGPVVLPKLYNGTNRTFFFGNFEKYYQKNVAPVVQTVPTEKMRAGDFSEILTGRQVGTDSQGRPIFENAIYDPLSQSTINGSVVRNVFPNNVIPASRFDPVASKIQNLIPRPTRAGILNNYDPSGENKKIQTVPAFKVDHTLSSAGKMSFYYSRLDSDLISTVDGLPEPITARRDQFIYSTTIRLNYDHSITPTFLLHTGVGYIRYLNPDSAPPGVTDYDAAAGLGLQNVIDSGFPRLGGLNSNFGGVQNISNGYGPTQRNKYWNDKQTAVVSGTLVRGSHTFKSGAEYKKDIWIISAAQLASGSFNFGGAETALPELNTTTVGGAQIGFPYASFLLGLVNNGAIGNTLINDYRRPSWALYVQDTWRASRKLTLEYGLRWDWTAAPHDRYYRTSAFSPSVRNPSAGNLLGGTAYEGYGPGRCDCQFAPAYPYAIGPRLGAAYQINDKTVIRAGWGITYGQAAVLSYIGSNTQVIGVGFNTLNFSSPAFSQPVTTLAAGHQFNRADLFAATLDPGIRPQTGTINVPPPMVDRNGSRPPRINNWNITLQREITKNLSVEVAYVGNRGVWLTSGDNQNLGLQDLNAISEDRLRSFGLSLSSAADRALLRSRIDSPAAAARGFVKPYATFPNGQTVAQSLRPYPQFGTLFTSFAPLGNSWYDSLQTKLTKRYSHGLDLTAAFTWQKELAIGGGNNRGRGENAGINDVFNREVNKILSPNSVPFIFVVGFNYETPQFTSNKILRAAVGGWTLGGIMRYQSGALIRVPGSNNNLGQLLFRGTFVNRVEGQPLFLKDPNGDLDPYNDAVLNPAAWQDAADGQWGTAAAYYNDYRWQRRPDEQLSLGRRFRFAERFAFSVRAEFFNVFNRVLLNAPSSGNITTPQTQAINGFGRLNPNNVGTPRTGQLVGRIEF